MAELFQTQGWINMSEASLLVERRSSAGKGLTTFQGDLYNERRMDDQKWLSEMQMEKTVTSMKALVAALDELHVQAGDEKASYLDQIKTLDSRIDEFVKACVEDGVADTEYRNRDYFPSADIRTAEFESDIRQEAESPESLFPMAADVLCRCVSEWFRNDLLLFARTTTLKRSLEVEVAGGIHPPYSTATSNPVSDRKKYEEKVEQLRTEGWIYKTRNNNLEITADASNLEKIRECVSKLEGRMLRFDLWDEIVRGFSFRIPSDKCREIFFALKNGKKEAEERVITGTISDDEVAVINRNLKDIKAALSSIGFMDDKSIILYLLRSYTSEIEQAMGMEDLICAKIIRRRHADEASKNRALRSRQEEKGEEVISTLDLGAAYEKIESGLQKVFYQIGLWVDDLESFSYATTRFHAIPRTYYTEFELRPGLKTVNEPGGRIVYLCNDPETIDRVVEVLREFMPRVRLENLQVKVRDFGQVIQQMEFTISPADIESLLEKTKDLEDVSIF